jgi:flagellar biosynthesis protein FliR
MRNIVIRVEGFRDAYDSFILVPILSSNDISEDIRLLLAAVITVVAPEPVKRRLKSNAGIPNEPKT